MSRNNSPPGSAAVSPESGSFCVESERSDTTCCRTRRNRKSGSPERLALLARPTSRRLRSLWEEKKHLLPPHRCDMLKSALEEDFFMTPEQTEEYFQRLRHQKTVERSRDAREMTKRVESARVKELKQRQQWLISFSAQIAHRLCDYLNKGDREELINNRLRTIADIVLEKVSDILGEPKPSRMNPGRLARFMVAISDRIAVWIESTVYRATALDVECDESCPEAD